MPKSELTHHRENTHVVTINDERGFEIAKLCKYTWGGCKENQPEGYDEFYNIEEIEKRGASIVQAVNSHHEMLEALRLVVKSISNPHGTSSDFEDAVFAAIAKAEGKS